MASTISTTSLDPTAAKALTLLGQGLPAVAVAAALGVSESRISQLISDPEFSAQVAELRFANLSKHSSRDAEYDSLEDSLLEKMKDMIPLMYKPMEVLKAISVINAAKRRGASAPEQLTSQAAVVQLLMPTQILQQFTTNINNQVIKTGDTDLVTIQSGNMKKLLQDTKGGNQDVIIPTLSSRTESLNRGSSEKLGGSAE
jgi:hypothetical protein